MKKFKIKYTDSVSINKKLIVEDESLQDALIKFLMNHPEVNDYEIEEVTE